MGARTAAACVVYIVMIVALASLAAAELPRPSEFFVPLLGNPNPNLAISTVVATDRGAFYSFTSGTPTSREFQAGAIMFATFDDPTTLFSSDDLPRRAEMGGAMAATPDGRYVVVAGKSRTSGANKATTRDVYILTDLFRAARACAGGGISTMAPPWPFRPTASLSSSGRRACPATYRAGCMSTVPPTSLRSSGKRTSLLGPDPAPGLFWHCACADA